METRYRAVLRKIYERSLELERTHVTDVYTGVEGDNRRAICQWLVQNGYIENVEYRGREIICCDITDKTIDFFDK